MAARVVEPAVVVDQAGDPVVVAARVVDPAAVAARAADEIVQIIEGAVIFNAIT